MRLVFFGTPEFAVQPLKALLSSGHEVVAVVPQPDRQSGRGRHVTFCPVKAEALKHGIKVLQPERVKDTGFIEELRALAPSVIITAAYGQILPSEIINLPEFACVNVHASLLPIYRGAAPINRAIMNGDDRTGITIMLMDEGMDTGPVLLKQEIKITADDTAGSLSKRLSSLGAKLLVKTLEELGNDTLKPVPQAGEISYAPVLKKTDGLIKWSKPAVELCNFIRGMNPWPCAYGFIGAERVKILKAAHMAGGGEPGVIKRVTKNELLVGTGKGMLSILELQPSGKPAMTVRAFLQGRKLKEGERICEESDG
ncbi:MAG TPA: methionyl-tRNA formyltransferase [Nitrospirae bacterium]|nr:methionyl-tRNA formyltransferase [bacterium BMS3Abin10]GBE39766.1 methionyl-tRNA formyltransferase [bacterium BMS3Bbin08]HDH50492.1 methionyl-tRNA formyltransferase [Nitrospirota bacterium]HDK17157.1 methionyl-tRNA formyltransferase [Nitrospirota bacterium]HDK82511.1 methionyl-tRNA formyltransferase [Nitrospirota bacterium]